MQVVGIIGGVASGKSLVATFFEQLGAKRIDADEIAHSVINTADVIANLTARWGPQILKSADRINRAAVANIVFSDNKESGTNLVYLESVMHPRIRERIKQLIDRYALAGEPGVVLDAAIMIKAGWNDLCDLVLYVDTPDEQRMQQALGRGWTREDFLMREARQEPLDTKRRLADAIIKNSGTPAQTFGQIKRICGTILKKF